MSHRVVQGVEFTVMEVGSVGLPANFDRRPRTLSRVMQKHPQEHFRLRLLRLRLHLKKLLHVTPQRQPALLLQALLIRQIQIPEVVNRLRQQILQRRLRQ